MANEEHLKILEQGIKAWNKWREENPNIKPNLRNAKVRNNLSEANLSMADLCGADLLFANLERANLRGANLNRANLSGAILSGAIIDENTAFRKIIGCRTGINGFYSRRTESAALIKFSPPGDSMQGADPNTIIENLKRARRLHGSSMLLAATVLIIAVLGLEEIKFTAVDIGKITPHNFGILAMPISLGILILVRSFMLSALNSIRFLNSRNSAMTVGHFPWILSKYEGRPALRSVGYRYSPILKISNPFALFFVFSAFMNLLLSHITRFVMCFHPLVYVYYWSENINKVFFILFFTLLMVFSLLIFLLSQEFQKPILFDTRTEMVRKSELEQLNDKLDELIDLLRQIKNINAKSNK